MIGFAVIAWLTTPPHSAGPATAARAQDRAEFRPRDLARHPPRARTPRRVPGDPRHFLVLVRGRRLPDPDSRSSRDRISAPDEIVGQPFIATFTIGIGVGSIFTNRLLKGEVSVKYVPIAAILITVFIDRSLFRDRPRLRSAGASDGAHADRHRSLQPGRLARRSSISASSPSSAACSVVPLYAILQTRASPPERARVIAANNIINAVFMTVATVVSRVDPAAGHLGARPLPARSASPMRSPPLYICWLLPRDWSPISRAGSSGLLYRVEVQGLENYAAAGRARGGRRQPRLAARRAAARRPSCPASRPSRSTPRWRKRWWVKPAFKLFDLFPVDPTNPMATKAMVNAVSRATRW